VFASGSTDCNIPLSEGIPAVAFGGYTGGCAHSLRKWIDAGSLETGYDILYDFIMGYFE
jgi:di/tripeptidase